MPNREEMQNLAHQIIGAYDERAKGTIELRASMNAEMSGFHGAHQAMAKSLRADLAKECADRQAGVGAELAGFHGAHQAMAKSLRADLAKECADRQATVGAALKGFQNELAALRKEQAGGRNEWRNLVTAMRARRGRPAKAAMARPKAPAAPMAEEARDLAALRSRVFEHLANHPDGSRLVELEGEMGASRFQMSRVVKSLMDDKKVEKRDLSYFAV